MGYTKSGTHPLPSTPTHPHPLPPIFNHFHPLPFMFSPLLLILSPLPPMYSLFHPFPVHIQILSSNPIHRLPFQPIFSTLHGLVTCVLMEFISRHFTAYVFILYVTLCVLIHQDYLFTLHFLKTYLQYQRSFLSVYFPPMFSLPIFFNAFISLML